MENQEKEKPNDQVVKLGPNIIGKEHDFEYVSGTEVMCKKCPLGYVVGPSASIKDGHIYIGNELVV